MTKIIWCSDIHLDFLVYKDILEFCEQLNQACYSHPDFNQDALIVATGDLSNGERLTEHLSFLDQHLNYPFHYVLGNHDYYGAKYNYWNGLFTNNLRWKDNQPWNTTNYLKQSPPIKLNNESCLIGVDGWADGQNGNPFGGFSMNDWNAIKDYFSAITWNNGKMPLFDLNQIINIGQDLANKEAQIAETKLQEALQSGFKHIWFATHIPPFKEATWHRGKMSEDRCLPWYSSKVMGDLLLKYATENPEIKFTVLCGHSHSYGEIEPLANLKVYTGNAEYGNPKIVKVFNL